MTSGSCTLGIALALTCSGASVDVGRKNTAQPTDERDFLALLHVVEHDRGEPYLHARDRLVHQGKRARPLLERQLDDPDPNRVQAAQVVLGWMDHAEEYRLVSDYLMHREQPPAVSRAQGVPSPIPAGTSRDMVPAVWRMQPLVVPRMIELLLKTDEIQVGGGNWSYLVASMTFDRRFVEPLAALMLDPRPPLEERLRSADTLRRDYRDSRWVAFAREIAWNDSLSSAPRESAFAMLATGRRTEELPRIRAPSKIRE